MLALVTIGVFGLFHPVGFELRPAPGNVLVVETNGRRRVLEGRGDSIGITSAASVTGRDGGETAFVLSIPHKIQREFHGRLRVVPAGAGHLTAIVEMDRETAVASIVAAEGPPGAPFEARKAQAVVTRSFLTASRGRHDGFDFCDTTHCEFLKSPPAPGSLARRAQEETRGLVLTYEGRPLAALYSADCGGRTRTLEQAGWHAGPYPYFSVECPIRGAVAGHGIGLCQVGAAEMARRGATFEAILNHFFPATAIDKINE